jgi:FkbM family methyltransferase
MKIFVKRILQLLLGFENYLYVFARYIISTLHRNRKEGDFLYFLGMLRDGETAIDIGANIGAMTVHLSRRLPASVIIAIEPVPCNIRTLKRVLKHYHIRNVVVVEKALGNYRGEIEMVLPVQKNVRLHGLSHVVHESMHEYNEGEKVKVAQIPLSELEELKGIARVGGIKIDVENYEYFVLDGGKELLKKDHPVVYMELWDNENRQKCFSLMRELSYGIQVLENGCLCDFDPLRHQHQNFFFIPLQNKL